MKEEEKQIWQAHQKRLAELERQDQALSKAYTERAQAIQAAYGGAMPSSEQMKMAKEHENDFFRLGKQKHAEIVRYMEEIEAYDRRMELQKTIQKSKFLGNPSKDRSHDKDDR